MEQKVFHFYISIHIPSVQPEFSSVPGCTPAVSGQMFRYIGKCNFALSAVLCIIQISFAVHNPSLRYLLHLICQKQQNLFCNETPCFLFCKLPDFFSRVAQSLTILVSASIKDCKNAGIKTTSYSNSSIPYREECFS